MITAAPTRAATPAPAGVGARPASAFFLCLFALAAAVPLYGGGNLTGADAVFFLIWPMIIPVVRSDKQLKMLWSLSALWAVGQFISNLFSHSKLITQLGTTGLVTAIMVTTLMWLHRELRAPAASVLMALAVGWLGCLVMVGAATATANPWKYGFAPPVSLFALALAARFGFGKRGTSLVLLSIAVVSLFNDSRMYMGVALIAALVLQLSGRRELAQRVRHGKRFAIGAIAIAVCLYAGYPALALSGRLGARTEFQQVQLQASGRNVLLANRPEALQIGYLILQHPILGVGSTTVISSGEADRALQLVDRYSQRVTPATRLYLLGSTAGMRGFAPHTEILTAILEGGLAVLPFWIFFLRRIFAGLRRVARTEAQMPAVLLFVSLTALWDTLFSPYTGTVHFALATTLFVVLIPPHTRDE